MQSPANLDNHSSAPLRTNRLANETSPYLLQHQHNPVDWYPWGEEAFERARREDRPIFLSVGYSTCYWCHVMERQSFENDAVAAVMNEKFVCIKVDREERPDVDQLYMTAVQMLTRQGGWPMSVWLTPDLRPFYGGTYFPPTDQYGRPGFVTLLNGLDDAYRNRKSDVERTAGQLATILRQMAEPPQPQTAFAIDESFIEHLIERSTSDYDPTHGGFGGAPKFPRETLLELLLVHQRHHPDARRMRKITHTLDALAAGGIRDHLGGGFHRYSTDAEWLVPHFEIMLYDNAMLAWCYVEAFHQTGEQRYAAVARGVLDFILREMTSPAGAFYTALDAEVDGQEGLNYLWTAEEIDLLLGPADAKRFAAVYGVDRGANFADPHHGNGVPDKCILYLPEPLDAVAAEMGMTATDLDASLQPLRQTLKSARDRRKQPLLDTKILTSWNALMARAFAYAGKILGEPRYVDAATKSMQFLFEHHRTPEGGLYRTSRDGKTQYAGFLDDYAYLAQAMLELDDAAGDAQWREPAHVIVQEMIERFGDPTGAGGFYFTDRQSTDLIVRQKITSDSPLPCGNAVAAMVLLELGDAERANATVRAFAESMQRNGEGMSAMVQAALLCLGTGGDVLSVSAGSDGRAARPATPTDRAKEIVRAAAEWTGPTSLRVLLEIAKGFHINAHAPGGNREAQLIPTRLAVEAAGPLPSIAYPAGKPHDFAFADAPVHVYDGDISIDVRFAAALTGTIRIGLTYQACDESACLPAVTIPVDVPPSPDR